jgi:hypothetical protein
MKNSLLYILLLLTMACSYPLVVQTAAGVNNTQLEFSPIRASVKSPDLKHDEVIISTNIISQPKYGGGRRSIVEIRGTIKMTHDPDNSPIPNGFVIGPRFRW